MQQSYFIWRLHDESGVLVDGSEVNVPERHCCVDTGLGANFLAPIGTRLCR